MSVCTLLPSTRSTPRRSLWAGSSKHGDGQVLPFSISAFWVSGAPLFVQRLHLSVLAQASWLLTMSATARRMLARCAAASSVSWPVTSALVLLDAPTGDTGSEATYASRSEVRTTRRPPIKQDGIEPSLSNSRNL